MKPKLRYLKYILSLMLGLSFGMAVYLFLDRPKIRVPAPEAFQITLDENVDWDSIQIEVSSILSDLIQIQTVRANESQAAFYIQKLLQKEGIQSKLIPQPDHPDKVSLIAELGPEDSQNGVILLNHLDVVEVNQSEWDFPAFSGELKDGIIHGRGAMDMKGMGSMELMAFIMIHRLGLPLRNKIMFLSVPDEESGGHFGTEFLLNSHESLFDGYKYVFNEGGFGIKDFPKVGNNMFDVQTAEKGVLWLELTAKGSSGHGSMPSRDYSSLSMVNLLKELQALPKFQLTDQSIEFFHHLGSFYGPVEKFLLQRIKNPIVQKMLSNKLRENKSVNAMVTNTVSITSIETDSHSNNVLPAETKALVDIRILPGVDPAALTAQISEIASKYNTTLDVKESIPASESTSETPLYDVLYSVLGDNVKGAEVTQYLSPGATDNRFFRAKGFECYGIVPVLIPIEDLSMLHGKNESISLENLKLGTKIIFETLVGFNQVESQ